MRRAWLIACKDMKESIGQRAMLLRTGLPVLLLPILYAVIAGLMLRSGSHNPRQAAALAGWVPMYAAFSALIGTLLTATMAANAVALERTRHTIEGLLATPVTDEEFFAGKTLAAFLPGLAAGYGAGVLYFATLCLIVGTRALFLPGVGFVVELLAPMLPVVVALEAILGVMLSARCGTVTGAQQVSGLVSLPIVGASIYLAYRASQWPLWGLLLLAAGFLVLLAALIYLGGKLLGREEIIARLD